MIIHENSKSVGYLFLIHVLGILVSGSEIFHSLIYRCILLIEAIFKLYRVLSYQSKMSMKFVPKFVYYNCMYSV